jgi:iron complex outermembrane receptor protein
MPYAPGGVITAQNPTGNLCQGGPGAVLPAFCSAPTFNLKAHVLGVEFQSRYNLTPDDQFNASGEFLDAKFDKQSHPCILPPAAPAGGCYLEGNLPTGTYSIITNPGGLAIDNVANETQPHAPKLSGNFSYQHTWELASGASVDAGVQIFASTGYWVHPLENPYSYQPTYWTQAMNVSYTPPSADWSVNAYVRNLSNYAIKEAYIPGQLGEPRTFGVVGNWHF